MFQGYVGVFLQVQLFLPDRDFPWFTFDFGEFYDGAMLLTVSRSKMLKKTTNSR